MARNASSRSRRSRSSVPSASIVRPQDVDRLGMARVAVVGDAELERDVGALAGIAGELERRAQVPGGRGQHGGELDGAQLAQQPGEQRRLRRLLDGPPQRGRRLDRSAQAASLAGRRAQRGHRPGVAVARRAGEQMRADPVGAGAAPGQQPRGARVRPAAFGLAGRPGDGRPQERMAEAERAAVQQVRRRQPRRGLRRRRGVETGELRGEAGVGVVAEHDHRARERPGRSVERGQPPAGGGGHARGHDLVHRRGRCARRVDRRAMPARRSAR